METAEQITKNIPEEEPQVKKQKDPKKVKAGNALAKKNAEARNLKQDEELNSNSPTLDVSTIYNGIQNAAVLVASGFTLYHGFKFYESYSKSTPKVESQPTPKVESQSTSQVESLRKSVDF